MAELITDGVVGFREKEEPLALCSGSDSQSIDVGTFYIANEIQRQISSDILAELSKEDDIQKRRELLRLWLLNEMKKSPKTKLYTITDLTNTFGELLGYEGSSPEKTFQTSIWKKCVDELKHTHPDHVWSQAGRPKKQ